MNEKKCLANDDHFCPGTLACEITCDYFLWDYLNVKRLNINLVPFMYRVFILHLEKKKAIPSAMLKRSMKNFVSRLH